VAIQFIDPVPSVLEEVKVATGKGVEFIQKDDLPTYATLQMARKHMPSHLIYYKKEHDEIINHLIVHECGHLFRIFKCPENQRLIPYSNNAMKLNALKCIEDEITELTKIIPEDKMAHITTIWYNGLIRQLTNYPTDIMIEKWIFDQFPKLRHLQMESLKRQHADALNSLSEPVSKMTPYTILFASNVMNYAFFRLLGFHIGHNFIQQYSSTPYINKGKELASLTEKEYVDSHQGDNTMIDKWATFFNISNWFKWRGFEDVPTNYGVIEQENINE